MKFYILFLMCFLLNGCIAYHHHREYEKESSITTKTIKDSGSFFCSKENFYTNTDTIFHPYGLFYAIKVINEREIIVDTTDSYIENPIKVNYPKSSGYIFSDDVLTHSKFSFRESSFLKYKGIYKIEKGINVKEYDIIDRPTESTKNIYATFKIDETKTIIYPAVKRREVDYKGTFIANILFPIGAFFAIREPFCDGGGVCNVISYVLSGGSKITEKIDGDEYYTYEISPNDKNTDKSEIKLKYNQVDRFYTGGHYEMPEDYDEEYYTGYHCQRKLAEIGK